MKMRIEFWQNIWMGLAFICAVILIILFCRYAFFPKTFQGYYLTHGSYSYRIYSNWDNAPDEIAFDTYDGELALKVLKELNNK